MQKQYLFIFLLLLFSCNRKPEEQKVSLTSSKIEISNKLQTILQQFTKENLCKNCINKVYIDKVYSIGSIDYKTIITIQQIPFDTVSYKKLKPSPILKVNFDSMTFFIYSGIEDYLLASYDKVDSTNKVLENQFVNWTIIDQKDSLIIRKRGEPPFSPFTPPAESESQVPK